MSRVVFLLMSVFVLLGFPAHAFAGGGSYTMYAFKGMIGTLVYSFGGFIILLVGYLLFDMFTPFDITEELTEKENIAVGYLMEGLFISLAIIIAAAITLSTIIVASMAF